MNEYTAWKIHGNAIKVKVKIGTVPEDAKIILVIRKVRKDMLLKQDICAAWMLFCNFAFINYPITFGCTLTHTIPARAFYSLLSPLRVRFRVDSWLMSFINVFINNLTISHTKITIISGTWRGVCQIKLYRGKVVWKWVHANQQCETRSWQVLLQNTSLLFLRTCEHARLRS